MPIATEIKENVSKHTATELGMLCIEIIGLKDKCTEKGLNDVVYFLELALVEAIDNTLSKNN